MQSGKVNLSGLELSQIVNALAIVSNNGVRTEEAFCEAAWHLSKNPETYEADTILNLLEERKISYTRGEYRRLGDNLQYLNKKYTQKDFHQRKFNPRIEQLVAGGQYFISQ